MMGETRDAANFAYKGISILPKNRTRKTPKKTHKPRGLVKNEHGEILRQCKCTAGITYHPTKVVEVKSVTGIPVRKRITLFNEVAKIPIVKKNVLF